MDQNDKPKKKWYLRWWMWGVYLVLAVIVLGSIGASKEKTRTADNNSSSATSQPVEAIKVAALQLSSDYKDNEIAADAKYKNKLIEVTGIVDSIGKDILDTPYISLQSYEYAIIDHVQCMFSKSQEPELATVSKGQRIVLKGTVSGKLGNVLVKGCVIVK